MNDTAHGQYFPEDGRCQSLWSWISDRCFDDGQMKVVQLLLLYALFNHPRRYSRFSRSRKLRSRIVLTGQFPKFLGVKAVGGAVQLNK